MLYYLKYNIKASECLNMSIKYPKSLNIVFAKLIEHGIKPIIVGGYVRDAILNIDSNDIDVELYNVSSFEYVEKLLEEFGSLNSVGKSFGICKLKYKNLELDFSLPRVDSKIASGHQGFQIKIDTSLDFATASSRRDFTLNAVGYDVKKRVILDPFNGIKDLKERRLKAVDLKKFDEDPLRVLRAVMFSSRFDFRLENSLFMKCKSMMQENVLQELPHERIFEEIKKILLQSKEPSKGFLLLKHLDGFVFFKEFNSLTNEEYLSILKSLDIFKTYNLKDKNSNIIIFLALLSSKFSNKQRDSFLKRLTNSKKMITQIELLVQTQLSIENFNNYEIYKLATKVNIEFYTFYLNALYHNKKIKKISLLRDKAKELGVLHKKAEPFISGKILLKHNMKASKLFSKILNDAYEAQMREEFTNEQEALVWLEKYLSYL